MNKTINKETQNNFEQGTSSSFEDILRQEIENLEKNIHQAIAVSQAVEHIFETLEEKFDFILDTDLDIIECPCEDNCGSIKVTVSFVATTITSEGFGFHKGEMSVIIKSKIIKSKN